MSNLQACGNQPCLLPMNQAQDSTISTRTLANLLRNSVLAKVFRGDAQTFQSILRLNANFLACMRLYTFSKAKIA